jgi:hypothetical protein
VPGWYIKLGHDRFLSHLLSLVIRNYRIIRRYIVRATENFVKLTTNKYKSVMPLWRHYEVGTISATYVQVVQCPEIMFDNRS